MVKDRTDVNEQADRRTILVRRSYEGSCLVGVVAVTVLRDPTPHNNEEIDAHVAI
jgi:hypothetical protein